MNKENRLTEIRHHLLQNSNVEIIDAIDDYTQSKLKQRNQYWIVVCILIFLIFLFRC